MMSKITEIKFSEALAQLVRDGKKTETRRPIKVETNAPDEFCMYRGFDAVKNEHLFVREVCRYDEHGHMHHLHYEDFSIGPCKYGKVGDRLVVKSETHGDTLLEITDIRCDLMRHMSPNAYRAEGVETSEEFAALWDSFYGEGNYASDPWVWVVCFNRVQGAMSGPTSSSS